MKRALLVVLFGLSGCVRFDEPRAYRCEAADQCDFGWVCLKDHYCHSPDVGARVACRSAATDCTGGWFCAQDGFCADPGEVGPLPCDVDLQCAGNWRCSTEHRCVDFVHEPQPAAFVGGAGALVVRSPLTTPGDLVRVAQTGFEVASDGQTALRLVGGTLRGSTLETVAIVSAWPGGGAVSVERQTIPLAAVPRDFAMAPAAALVVRADGTALLLTADGGTNVALPFAATRAVPLVWGGGALTLFGVLSNAGEGALISASGDVLRLQTGMIDYAASDTDGGNDLFFLRQSTGNGATLSLERGGVEKEVYAFTDPDAGQPLEVRVERGGVVARVEDRSFGGIIATSAVQHLCLDCKPPSASRAVSCGGGTLTDFGLSAELQPIGVCTAQASEVLYSLDARDMQQARLVRDSERSSGTGGGHVRQLHDGQLVLSPDFVTEFADVLPTRPVSVALRQGFLVAVEGEQLYRFESAHGFVPFGHTDPLVSNVASFVDGSDFMLLREGSVLESLPNGEQQVPFVVDVPEGVQVSVGARARLVGTAGGHALIVASADALYAGLEDAQFVGVARPRLRPAPGFPIDDWMLRADDAGFLEGWAVANNRLFRVTASGIERWKSVEVPLTGRDPVGLLQSGAAVLLVTTSGETLALPSRVPVAGLLEEDGFVAEVLDAASVCSSSFLTTASAVYELGNATDGGLGQWKKLDHRALIEPRLMVNHQHLFVTDQTGVVLEQPVVCP